MLLGQALLITPFSITYPFYLFSCFSVIAISVLYWIAQHLPLTETYLVLYYLVIAVLIVVPFVIHFFTRKRNIGTFSFVPLFSIFLFGLLLTFGISQTIGRSTQDSLFYVTMVLFILTSIFGLNNSFRTLVLDRNLGIKDRNSYVRKCKDDLLKKYLSTDASDSVNLLIYYLGSSLDAFVEGDFERSFMDSYKIVFDLNGKAFKAIYELPENKERQKHFSDIRNLLSHAHIRQRKAKEGTEETKKDFQKLKDVKKTLFRDTLDILKIVKFEFIEVALKKEQSPNKKG